MKMHPRTKAAWVKALRSGDYAQGRGQLRDAEGCCCLGVLCELKRLPREQQPSGVFTYRLPEGGSPFSTVPPRDFAGLDADTVDDLTELNDDKRWSFKQIARWIEAHL